nr:hypothetical protein [Mycobacterium leprae]
MRLASEQQIGFGECGSCRQGTTRALLDAVDNATSNIRHAVAALPSLADSL